MKNILKKTHGRKCLGLIDEPQVKYQITAPLHEWLRRIRAQRRSVTSPGGVGWGGTLGARTGMSERVNGVKREATGSQRMWSVNYEKGCLEQRQRQL